MKLSTPLKSIVAVSGIVFATSAIAGDEYSVTYKSSELANFEGVGEVHARIVNAAEDYCPTYQESDSLSETKACIAEVTQDLIEKISHPTLTSYHERESGVAVANVTRKDVTDPS